MKFFSMTGEFFIGVATTLILLYFLLSSGDLFLHKLVKVLHRRSDKRRAVEIVRQIEEQLFRYLFTVTCINVGLGTSSAWRCIWLGMPNPIFWGTMAALLTFIPYLGHIFGIIVVMLVAAMTFDELGQMFLVGGVYWGLALLEGWFATPMILGQRLEINPVVLLIGLMLWGWIWGIGGALLAVPHSGGIQNLLRPCQTPGTRRRVSRQIEAIQKVCQFGSMQAGCLYGPPCLASPSLRHCRPAFFFSPRSCMRNPPHKVFMGIDRFP